MRRISWIIIGISLLLGSCTTPVEYRYVFPEPVKLPSVDEAISRSLTDEVNKPLDLIREPKTVGDVLHNMQEYQQGYILMKRYSGALKDYIDTIITIHNDGGIKDGSNGDI